MHFKLHLTIMHNIYLVLSEVNSHKRHTPAPRVWSCRPCLSIHPTTLGPPGLAPSPLPPVSTGLVLGCQQNKRLALHVSKRGIQVRKDRSQHEARQLFSSNEAPSNARGLADSQGGAVRRHVHTPDADSSAYNVRLDAILGGTARPVNSPCLSGERGRGEEARYSPVPPPPPAPAARPPDAIHKAQQTRSEAPAGPAPLPGVNRCVRGGEGSAAGPGAPGGPRSLCSAAVASGHGRARPVVSKLHGTRKPTT